MSQYVPGKTNIDKKSAKKRLGNGWRALVAAFFYVVIIYVLNIPQLFMLVVALPLFVGVRLVLEGSSHFSVTYGLHGLYDMGEGVKHTKEDEETQLSDRTKAQSILFFATVVSVLGSLFCYVVLV